MLPSLSAGPPPSGRLDELVALLTDWSGCADLTPRLRAACGRCERVMELVPARLLANSRAVAEALEISPAVFLHACCGHPDLLYQSPQAMKARVLELAAILGMTPKRLVALVGTRGDLLMFSPESVREKLAETARRLGISVAVFVGCLRKAPALWGLRPERIALNAQHLADVLGTSVEGAVSIAVRSPAILLRSEDGIDRFIADGSAAFGVPRDVVANMICRCPSLLSQKIATLHGNATRFAELLGVEPEAVIGAAQRNPAFLRCNPEHSARTLEIVAERLGMSLSEMGDIALRMPSLIGRTADGTVKRVRLAARISSALGRPLAPSEMLVRMPAVPTYSVDRLLVRLLIARLGLWTWDAGSLIAKSDRHIRSLLEGYAAQLPVGSREALRLFAIIERRMPKAK